MATVKDIDRGWREIRRQLKAADGVRTKVGLPAGGEVSSGTRDGSHEEATDMSELASIGAIHEFGAPGAGIPERSWLRSTYDESKNELAYQKNIAYGRMIEGKSTARQAIGRVGEWLTTAVKKKIRDLKIPPNAPQTITRKGSSNPLIDTGQMIQSVQHVEVG
jgi:hypothetical protein